ncbi:uncharacterized protein LOC121878297 [Homarus americanus]|nr:uncharacterized protein LOC121878297 [Homarus americanus]
MYQVSLNLLLYLEKPTVFMVSFETNPVYRLPPVSICPHPAFEPRALGTIGLTPSEHYIQYLENYMELRGVPANVTPRELWKRARWDLSHIIEAFALDLNVVHHYNSTDPLTPMWRRSYSPLGPCLTLNSLPGVRKVGLYLQELPPVKPCMIPNDNGELQRYRGTAGQCEQAKIFCNTSCGLEDSIYFQQFDVDKMHIYFHETPVYAKEQTTEEDILIYSDQLFDGNYVLMEISKIPNLKSYPQMVESSLIKGPCNSDRSYTHAQCFREMHKNMALQELGCYPFYLSTPENSSKPTCRSPDIMDKLFYLESSNRFPCPQRCKQQRWSHDITLSYDIEFFLLISALSTDIRKEVELETYPLAQLFCDIGGSLGLFLGVSILSLLELFVTTAMSICSCREGMMEEGKKRHMTVLIKYTVILILCIATGTHYLEVLRSYLTQPKLTSVSLRVAKGGNVDDLTTLVARRLATRTLDCRPEETFNEECVVLCLLRLAAKDGASVTPFLDIEGLTPCQNVAFHLPSNVYVVPPEQLLAATMRDKVDKCRDSCTHLPPTNKTMGDGFIMVVDKNHYSSDFLQLMCNIGGIVGFYLGFSIFDFLDFIHSVVAASNLLASTGFTKERSSKVLQILKLCTVFLGIILALWQLNTFLVWHKISSSITKSPRTNRTEQLAITVCRWPPVSLHHLAAELQLNISERLIHKLPKEERQPEFLRILETLPGNWSSTLDVLWSRAAWNITDVVEGFFATSKEKKYFTGICSDSSMCQNVWMPVITPLNRCFSLNTMYENTEFTEITLIFPKSLEKRTIFGDNPQIYVTVNPIDEPPMMADMIPKKSKQRVIATHHAIKYERLDDTKRSVDDDSHSTCVHRCLSEGASAHLRCRLPYVTWRPDLDPCNQHQYTTVHKFFKGLIGIGVWNKVKINENASQDVLDLHYKCYEECRHLQHTYYAITTETMVDIYPTVVVRLYQEEDILLREEDRHTISQLLSDLGGIAGITAGFSLLFILKELAPRAFIALQRHP